MSADITEIERQLKEWAEREQAAWRDLLAVREILDAAVDMEDWTAVGACMMDTAAAMGRYAEATAWTA